LAIFGFIWKKFDTVQIDAAVADFSANPNWFVTIGTFEFNIDLAAHRQVGGREKANTTLAELDAASVDDGLINRLIDHDAQRRLKRITLPASSICLLIQAVPTPRNLLASSVPRLKTPRPCGSPVLKVAAWLGLGKLPWYEDRTVSCVTYRFHGFRNRGGKSTPGKEKRWDTPETAGPPQYDSLYPTLAGNCCRHDNSTDFFTKDEWLYFPKSRQLVPQKLCNMSEIYCLSAGFHEVQRGQIQEFEAAFGSEIPACLSF
jgi:hypothetical protein